jgi:hypothetical protein
MSVAVIIYDRRMGRWEPDARGRLEQAALALYGERGFEQRGVAEPAASLAAEAGIAVFRVAFERWIDETSQADLPQLSRDSLDDLKAVTAGM